ncbi:hypothetical protein PH189_08965 [Actinomycetospora chibensis]|nr:hypothetical protein [Actinomycetospora chibensis]MDD7923695.1 hypothetical protein [Actinomycetospora chibensis]
MVRSSIPAVEPSSSRIPTCRRSTPIGVSTPRWRTAAASASMRAWEAIPSGAGASQNDRFAVPDGVGVRITRARASARRRRRWAQSGSSAVATCAMRSITAPTGSPGASGSTSRHTSWAWSSARSRVCSQSVRAFGSSSHPAYRASPTSGSRTSRSSARSSLREDMVRDQPSSAATSSPQNSSHDARRSVRPACARPRWWMPSSSSALARFSNRHRPRT